jgi:hypothetical protein
MWNDERRTMNDEWKMENVGNRVWRLAQLSLTG